MNHQIPKLLHALDAKNMTFFDVLAFIDDSYHDTPTAFYNGDAYNDETQNQASAKVLYFAKMHQLSKADTLLLFAEHYQSVQSEPHGTTHANIRAFMQYGWAGVRFCGHALTSRDKA